MKNFQSHECKPTTKETDAKVEHVLREWIKSQQPRKVSSTEVRHKAREIYREHGRLEIECSYGWYRRFKARMLKNGVTTGMEKFSDEDDGLILSWLLKVYDNNQLVSYRELQDYAQNALREIKPEFKASAGWALRFLKRNHILVNWREGLYTKEVPPSLQCHVERFCQDVRVLLGEIPESRVGCMDEIPLSFTSPTTSKLRKGDVGDEDEFEDSCKSSRLKKLSVKNCDATVVLGLLADGTFLPPMVIVKGQLSSSLNQVYNTPQSSVVAYYSTSTEPTVASMERWIDLVWRKSVKDRGLIIVDSYEIHPQLQSKFAACNTQYLEIPSGCSIKLQPLNVLAKGVFLKNMDKLWLEYLKPNVGMDEDSFERMRLPSTNEVVEWVQKSYEATLKLQVELTKSFSQIFLQSDQ